MSQKRVALFILTCLRYMLVDFIKLRKTVYILHISIYRLLTSPPFFVAFCVFFLGSKHFLWPMIGPQRALSQSHHYCVLFAQIHPEILSRYFSETVHLRVISTPRIGNGKKLTLGQVVTVLILLSHILYDCDLITLMYWFLLQFSLKVLGMSHNHKGTVCQDWLKEAPTYAW